MADKIAETDNQSNLPSLKSGSTEDVQAAREDLEALKAELQDALAHTPPGAASCDGPENSQLNQVCTPIVGLVGTWSMLAMHTAWLLMYLRRLYKAFTV